MFQMSIKVEGLKELDKALAELSRSASKAVMRRALERAATPTLLAATALAPGGLALNIDVNTRLTKFQRRRGARLASDEVGMYIGTTFPAGAQGHLIEFGTGPRYHKNGKYIGQVAAKPFLRPAWDATKHRVLELISRELWAAIDKVARRAANKAIRRSRMRGMEE
jgi:hypothetical protein